jgi:hypothetical protein
MQLNCINNDFKDAMNHRLPDVALKPGFFLMQRAGVFAWPAWLRMLAVLPACLVLWLAVCWALA